MYGVDFVCNSTDAKLYRAKVSGVNSFDLELPKILVVDDHPASRMTAVAILSVEGYEVLEADSGLAALDLSLIHI